MFPPKAEYKLAEADNYAAPNLCGNAHVGVKHVQTFFSEAK